MTVIPPIIRQYFSHRLLLTPTPKFRDCCDIFEEMLQTIDEMWYKLKNNPKRLQRCEALRKKILQLYERAKTKEKEREAEKDHKTQEFGYYVAIPTPMGRDVYQRLRFGSKSGAVRFKFRPNYAIPKTSRVKR